MRWHLSLIALVAALALKGPASAEEDVDSPIDEVATAHSARIFPDKGFDQSVKTYRDFDCPDDRPLCSS